MWTNDGPYYWRRKYASLGLSALLVCSINIFTQMISFDSLHPTQSIGTVGKVDGRWRSTRKTMILASRAIEMDLVKQNALPKWADCFTLSRLGSYSTPTHNGSVTRMTSTNHNCLCLFVVQGPDSIQRWYLTSIGNPIVEIRRSYDRLISTMGFPIPVRRHLYIESGPRVPSCQGLWPHNSNISLITPENKSQ